MNNTVPLAGLRNEIGRIVTPHMREINSGVLQSWRNRNLASEYLTNSPLPVKYDMLNGQPIRDYDFLTRSFNAISPISFNLDSTPGRELLFNSGYDLRMSTYYAPDGTNLTDHPQIRSRFQQAIGQLNLEYDLDQLAKDERIIASIQLMKADIRAGKRGEYNARDYYHNLVIDKLFKDARIAAWNEIKNEEAIYDLRILQQETKQLQDFKTYESYNVLNMYK